MDPIKTGRHDGTVEVAWRKAVGLSCPHLKYSAWTPLGSTVAAASSSSCSSGLKIQPTRTKTSALNRKQDDNRYNTLVMLASKMVQVWFPSREVDFSKGGGDFFWVLQPSTCKWSDRLWHLTQIQTLSGEVTWHQNNLIKYLVHMSAHLICTKIISENHMSMHLCIGMRVVQVPNISKYQISLESHGFLSLLKILEEQWPDATPKVWNGK